MAKKLGVGDKIPSFSLTNQAGQTVSSTELLGAGPLVIYFYPKDDTPGCTAEACAFRDQYEVFKEAGAEVVGISSDSTESHSGFAARHSLPFVLLSDPGGKLRKQFGARDFGLIPGRYTYVVDRDGVIRHTFTSQFRATQHVEEALGVIKRLAG